LADEGRFSSEARNLGKRERTRARLMDAAVGIFASVGYESASVNEIARAADVANGTFYLHFKDKDAIVAAVALRIAGDVVRHIDQAMKDIDDAIERTSYATRQLIHLACSEPQWGWALLRAISFLPDLRQQGLAYLRADLQRGVRQGAFNLKIDEFVVEMFASMVLTALQARLRGDEGADAGAKVAELQLRMLGVSSARAHRAAWRPLEPLQLSVRMLSKAAPVRRSKR
jgi:AcrR family transcriptional regulator